MKFRKKPVVIDAALFDGSLSSLDSLSIPELSQELTSDTCQIVTLEGVMTASKGDWVIRGVKGEHYPCKPDIFAATYDAVQDEQPPQDNAHIAPGCERFPEVGLTFGAALGCLKGGQKIARAGWNGKGMWLLLVPGTPDAVLREGTPYAKALGAERASCEILPHIDMWTTNASGRRAMLPGWLASQSDMLAEDWQIIL